jgi:hypothetical protein
MQAGELFALRAFIQRGESRLATMHAIAGAFISGAGLLVLFPLLYRDTLGPITRLFFAEIEVHVTTMTPLTDKLLGLWIVPFLCALILPIYSIILLVQELVILYFIPHSQAENFYLPRFALAALTVPLDDPKCESTEDEQLPSISSIKRKVIEHIYQHDLSNAIPPDRNHPEWKNLARLGRRYSGLVSDLPQRKSARLQYGADDEDNRAWIYDVRAGKSGLADRSLIGEAARLETTLVRVNARLRVMAIRYFKSLLLLIWTLIVLSSLIAAVSYIQVRLLQTPADKRLSNFKYLSEYVCLSFGLMWACLTPIIVNLPLRWIRQTGDKNTKFARHRDIDLSRFELVVFVCCGLSFFASLTGLWTGILYQLDVVGREEVLVWTVALILSVITAYSLARAMIRLAR